MKTTNELANELETNKALEAAQASADALDLASDIVNHAEAMDAYLKAMEAHIKSLRAYRDASTKELSDILKGRN